MLSGTISRRRAWMLLMTLPALPVLGRIAADTDVPGRTTTGTGHAAGADGWILRRDDR